MAARFEFDLRFEHAAERVAAREAALPLPRHGDQAAAAPFDPRLQPAGQPSGRTRRLRRGPSARRNWMPRSVPPHRGRSRDRGGVRAELEAAMAARVTPPWSALRPGWPRFRPPSSRRWQAAPVATSHWRWRGPWCRGRSSGSRSPTSRRCCATFWSASRARADPGAAAGSARSRRRRSAQSRLGSAIAGIDDRAGPDTWARRRPPCLAGRSRRARPDRTRARGDRSGRCLAARKRSRPWPIDCEDACMNGAMP